MAPTRVLLLAAVTLCTSSACTTTAGGVALRPDGTPGPEECSKEALTVMRILRLHVGDAASVELDVNQTDDSPITLYDGPVESMLNDDLGILPAVTRLYGRVWTSGPHVIVRYYEAHPPDGEKVPICAVARLAKGQLRKLPGSKPGTALLEFSKASVYVVESFR
jgi:hypothetical protein